jgi:hypothetical protein
MSVGEVAASTDLQSKELTPERLEELIQLREEISTLAPHIAKSIAGKSEPVADLNKLNFLLDAHFEDVWQMLHTPAHLL